MKSFLFLLVVISTCLFAQDKSAKAWLESGDMKYDAGDNYGAIADYTIAIEIKPDFADAYNNRGFTKYALGDYYGAIEDYTKAIKIKPDFADAYFGIGCSKHLLGDLNGACSDWKVAARLGHVRAQESLKRFCD